MGDERAARPIVRAAPDGHFLPWAARRVQSSTDIRAVQRGFRQAGPDRISPLVGDAFADLYEGDGASAHARLETQWPAVMGARLHRIRVVDVQMKHLSAATA